MFNAENADVRAHIAASLSLLGCWERRKPHVNSHCHPLLKPEAEPRVHHQKFWYDAVVEEALLCAARS